MERKIFESLKHSPTKYIMMVKNKYTILSSRESSSETAPFSLYWKGKVMDNPCWLKSTNDELLWDLSKFYLRSHVYMRFPFKTSSWISLPFKFCTDWYLKKSLKSQNMASQHVCSLQVHKVCILFTLCKQFVGIFPKRC